jgi:pimeloyl-ACP methyl ester carboxylesterase
MRVWEQGDGMPLLALHGLGGSGRYWQGLADRVGERFRVIAPDLAGFGTSDKPRHASYDRAFHLADVDTVVATFAPEGVIAVTGHSLGAMLALLWAARRTTRVGALALVATPYPLPSERWDPNAVRGARAVGMRAVAGAFRVAWPVVSLPVIAAGRYPGPVVRDFGRQALHARIHTLYALWSDPTLPDAFCAIEAIPETTPVTLIHARDDARVPVRNVERWRTHIAHAEPLVLPDGGHQVLLRTRFEPVVRWLARLEDPSSPTGPRLGR